MKKLKTLVILGLFALLPVFAFTQPDPRHNGNGSNVGNTPVGDHSSAPIDGGLSVLIVLSLGYGAKKFREVKPTE